MHAHLFIYFIFYFKVIYLLFFYMHAHIIQVHPSPLWRLTRGPSIILRNFGLIVTFWVSFGIISPVPNTSYITQTGSEGFHPKLVCWYILQIQKIKHISFLSFFRFTFMHHMCSKKQVYLQIWSNMWPLARGCVNSALAFCVWVFQ